MSDTERTPAEQVISTLNTNGLIVWDGMSDRLCGRDGDDSFRLDPDGLAVVQRIITEDWRAIGGGD